MPELIVTKSSVKSSVILATALLAAFCPRGGRAYGDVEPSSAGIGQAIPAQPSNGPFPGRMDPSGDPPQADQVPVQREYDRFADQNTVKIEGVRPAIMKGESRLFINASSIFDGTEVSAKPDKVALNLLCVSDDFQFADTRENLTFIVLVDKERFKVPAKFIKAGLTKDRFPKCLESFVAIVPADVVVRMATGESIEGQLGPVEFKIGLMEKASFHGFAEAVKLVGPSLATAPQANGIGVRPDELAFRLAQAKIDNAQQRLDEATSRCNARLEQSPEFILAQEAVKEAEQKKDHSATGPQRVEASQSWLAARGKLSLLRANALQQDAGAIEARKTLTDAQAALSSLRQAERAAYHARAR